MSVESHRLLASLQHSPSFVYRCEFSQSSNFSIWWRVCKLSTYFNSSNDRRSMLQIVCASCVSGGGFIWLELKFMFIGIKYSSSNINPLSPDKCDDSFLLHALPSWRGIWRATLSSRGCSSSRDIRRTATWRSQAESCEAWSWPAWSSPCTPRGPRARAVKEETLRRSGSTARTWSVRLMFHLSCMCLCSFHMQTLQWQCRA